MREESRNKILSYIFLPVIILIAAVSCGGDTTQENTEPGEQVIEESAQTIDIPEVPAMFEDMLYPDAEFLFEISGMGGPMIPYRFYVASGTSIDQAADFYLKQLPWFDVEKDEVENGFRHLMLTYSKPLDQLGEVEDPNELPQKGSELDGALMGVEVVHSSVEAGFSRLVIAKEAYDRGGDIPSDSTIIVFDYFKNPY